MQDIVHRAGLSPGAIYGYFASKEEIVEAIADERHRRERELLSAADGCTSVAAGLAQLAEEFVGALRDPAERARRRVGIQLWAEALRNSRVRPIVRRGLDEPRRKLAEL